MTARELLGALLRWWLLVAVAGAVTVAAVLYLSHPRVVYFSEFEVTVLPPNEPPSATNNLRGNNYGLVPMASLLVAEFNQGHHPLDMGTDGTTLYGEGERAGQRVRLQNVGSQWTREYPRPVIDVQVVGPDPSGVRSRSRSVVGALERILAERQDSLSPPADLRMTLVVSPTDPVVAEVGGNRARAAGGMLLLGGALTLTSVISLERWRRGRILSRRLVHAQPVATAS